MKQIICRSIVQIIGKIWMPPITCGQEKTLTRYDVDNCRDEDGKITRESVEHWLTSNAGDFQAVEDFSASIEDGENTIEIPWASEGSELKFFDCMDSVC